MEMLAMPLATIIRYTPLLVILYIYIYVREYNTRGLLRNRDAFALIKNYFDQVGSIARSSNIEDVIKKNIEIDRLSRPIFIQF